MCNMRERNSGRKRRLFLCCRIFSVAYLGWEVGRYDCNDKRKNIRAAITNGARKSRRLKPSSCRNSGESSSGLRILYSAAAILSFNLPIICPLHMVDRCLCVFANDILLYHILVRVCASLQRMEWMNNYKTVYFCDKLHAFSIFIF